MAADLATLAVRLDNSQAIASAKQTGQVLDDMGAKGERAALRLVKSSNPVTDAIKLQANAQRFLAQAQMEAIAVNERLGTNQQRIAAYTTQAAAAHRAMTLKQIEAIAINEQMGASVNKVSKETGFWAAIQGEAAGGVGKHSLAVGRLERGLAGVTERALGLNPIIGLLGASLGKFAIGSIELVAILLAIGAASWVWNTITDGATKAKKATDDLIDSLVKERKAAYDATVAGRDLIKLQAEMELEKAKSANPMGWRSYLGSLVRGAPYVDPTDVRNAGARTTAARTAVSQATTNLTKAWGESDETAFAAGQEKIAAAYRNRGVVAGELTSREERLHDEVRKATLGLEQNEAAYKASQITIRTHADWLVEDAKKYREVKDAAEANVRTATHSRDSLLLVGRALEVSNIQWEYQNKLIEISKTLHGQAAQAAVAGAQKVRDVQMATLARGWDTATVKRALSGTEDTFGQFFGDLVTRGTRAWGNLMDNIKGLYAQVVSDLAKVAFETKILPKIAGMFGLTADPGAALMKAAAGENVTAGGIMKLASAEMMSAAVLFKTGTLPSQGGTALPPVTATANTGLSKLQMAGAGVGGLFAGYGIGGALYNQSHSGAQNYATGALGGAAGGAAVGFMVGGPIGAAIGGVAGFVGGLLGVGSAAKKAAAEMHRLQDELKTSFADLRAKVAGDTLGQALAANDSELKKFLLQINAALPGSANEAERNRERSEAASLYGQLADQIKKADARQKAQAGEDLQVRLLTAQGRDKEATALRLQLAQQREMQDAVAAHTDPATLALLAQVQAQEKLKAATDAAVASGLNMVDGYKLQAAIFRASSPHAPTGPLVPFAPTPLPAIPSSDGGDLTVPLVVDGKVLAQVVLKNFKGAAQKTTGKSTEWASIQSVS